MNLSEILNRLLLIAFSCILILLLLPLINPIFDLISDSDVNQDKNEILMEVRNEIDIFKENVNYYRELDLKERITYTFQTTANVSVIWFNHSQNSTELDFLCYYQTNKFPLVFEIYINFGLNISRNSNYFEFYQLSFENSMIFLTFF